MPWLFVEMENMRTASNRSISPRKVSTKAGNWTEMDNREVSSTDS